MSLSALLTKLKPTVLAVPLPLSAVQVLDGPLSKLVPIRRGGLLFEDQWQTVNEDK
jgi:hypothetical protein